MIISNKDKNTETYIIPNKGYIHLSNIKSIVSYCKNGCNVSTKCSFFEKCRENPKYTMVKITLQDDIEIRLTYKEYIAFEKVFIDSGYITEPIFKYS